MFGGYSPPSASENPIFPPPVTVQRKITRTGICKICSKQFGTGGIINCHSCNLTYHHSCSGITEHFYQHFIISEGCPWYCYNCETKLLTNSSAITNSIEEAKKEIQKAVDQQFNTLRATIFTNKQETDIKLAKLEKTLREEIQTVKQTNSETPDDETLSRINFLEAQIKKKNLLISGVPISENEDLRAIIVKIGQACNINIHPASIEEVQRLSASSKKGPPPGGSVQRNEAPTILIKFFTEIQKVQLFDAYINRIKNKQFLKCDAIGYTSEKRIFMNHHLSPMLRKIHDRALLLLKANLIEKVNSRSHAISIKINGKWHNVTSETQLDLLVKPQTSN
jgi:hypothetical protein